MAIVNVTNDLYNGTETNQLQFEYQGLSTDIKPTLEEKNNGSEFLELDTGSYFVWHTNAWVEL